MNRKQALDTARILRGALPYIQAFSGKLMVIKLGGSALSDDMLNDFAHDITLLQLVGIKPIIVHGGGPQIAAVLEEFDIKSRFVQGLRVTDERTMAIVEMVLRGKVNKAIVTAINQAGGRAAGLSGNDGDTILAKPIEMPKIQGQAPIDMGWVGDVAQINSSLPGMLSGNGYIPVVAPLGIGRDGATYNINADTVASFLADSLHAEKLIFMSNVEGIQDANGELIPQLKQQQLRKLIDEDVVKSGMLPKTNLGMQALNGTVNNVHIIDGRVKHALLLELFTDHGIGTQLLQDSDSAEELG